jgi:hypothetical protein
MQSSGKYLHKQNLTTMKNHNYADTSQKNSVLSADDLNLISRIKG